MGLPEKRIIRGGSLGSSAANPSHLPSLYSWEGQGELVQSQAVLNYAALITQTTNCDSARSGERSPTSSTSTLCTQPEHSFPLSPSRETRCGVPVRPQTLSSSVFFFCFFLRHGGPPPKALHQSGLTMGKMSVHGEPKFSEGQPRVFTNQVRVKTLHELHHGPEKVKILVEAISVKDAKGYIAYTKAKKQQKDDIMGKWTSGLS